MPMNKKIKSNHKKFKKEAATDIYDQFPKKSKRQENKERESYLETLSTNLKIPSDILTGAPILTATGKNQICLENYKGIIEYTGNLIRIQTKICRIHIEGENLNIDYFTDEEMRISGVIHNIYYC
jgi:sporulation protein YqfC